MRTPGALARAIRELRADTPIDDSCVWYRNQKEHWLGWLQEYNGPGTYGRKGTGRSAEFAYNHIVEPKMLLWLIAAAGVDHRLVRTARRAAVKERSMMSQSRAIRERVPWSVIERALWP